MHYLLLATLLLASAAGAESISGVCPDGSIFIVQRASAIPCRNAKQVDPEDIPPLNPEYLPRPYGWEVFNRESDPYNPYNVVDTVRPGAAPPPTAPPPTPAVSTPATPSVAAAPPVAPSAPPSQASLSFALAPQELDDLVAILAVLQQHAPATLVRAGEAGPGLELRLGRSAAFEARVAEVLAGRGTPATGPVIAFHVEAHEKSAFWGNFTFVQGHMAFVPESGNPAQLGLVEGAFGPLLPGQRVLGYAVLPSHADPSQPLDVYWNDRRLTATFSP